MLIVKRKIRLAFKEAGKRVPIGFIDALNTLAGAIVEAAVVSGKGSIHTKDVVSMANKSQDGLMGRYVNEAFASLEKEGKLDQGLLIGRAKELQAQATKERQGELYEMR